MIFTYHCTINVSTNKFFGYFTMQLKVQFVRFGCFVKLIILFSSTASARKSFSLTVLSVGYVGSDELNEKRFFFMRVIQYITLRCHSSLVFWAWYVFLCIFCRTNGTSDNFYWCLLEEKKRFMKKLCSIFTDGFV